MTPTPTELFQERPRWQRVAFRLWRVCVLSRLPGHDRHGLPRRGYRYIVPPRELSNAQAHAMIRRGQELARKFGS